MQHEFSIKIGGRQGTEPLGGTQLHADKLLCQLSLWMQW